MEQLHQLSVIAKSEPQAAYSAFTAGFRHKITYFIRTIPNMKELLKPLDDVVENTFIPAITEGHHCSPADRKLLALPVRLGGMGIPIFTEIAEREYANSRAATEKLTTNIRQQQQHYVIDEAEEREIQARIKKGRKDQEEKDLKEIRSNMAKDQLRANDLAQMKGASAWLNALPLKDEGYTLNKREFFDAVSLRYRWRLKRLPIKCVCGVNFDVDHAMHCRFGGFTHRRHDQIRDMLAEMVDGVAYDVQIEPPLQQLTGEELRDSANKSDEARLDFTARGFWQRGEMAFFDVRVFNPFAKTHLNTKLETAFEKNETSKKNEYNERVIKVEHGSFTPVVLSAYGGVGRETSRFISSLITKISEKHDLQQSTVANYIRTKISFDLIRSQVMCIRGSRKRRKIEIEAQEIEVVESLSRCQRE